MMTWMIWSTSCDWQGVVRAEATRLVVRNRIYERIFDRQWVAATKPCG